jgi:hypothetical protein
LKAHEKFIPLEQLQEHLNSLNLALSSNDVPTIRRFLQQLVAGYEPNNKIVDWVYLESNK